jgi:uncharacterized membrane protein YjgN (DUF898 family)
MPGNFFFKDRSGAQNGPVSLEELATLAATGRLAPDCLVWGDGVEPSPASAFDALAAAFRDAPKTAATAAGRGPLEPSFPVWGLFWRSLVYAIGVTLILPAPWVGVWFYRFVAEHVALPGGKRLHLESTVGESGWIFAGLGLAAVLDAVYGGAEAAAYANLIGFALGAWLTVRLIDWFCRSLRAEDGSLSLVFAGESYVYLGWILLLVLSTVAVIAWAWVLKYMLRWVCAKIAGTHRFEFVATGFDLLWRIFVLVLAMAFLIPLPWAMRWFQNWFVSQIVVTPAAASLAQAQRIAA